MDELLTRNSAERVLLDIVQGTVRDLRAEAPIALRVTLDSSLDGDLAFDSLARVELLLRIERAFAVDLPEDTLQSAETVRDLLSAVKRARDNEPAMPSGTGVASRLAPPVADRREDDAGAPSAATTLLQMLDWHLQAHADQVQIVVLADNTQHEISYAKLAAGSRAIGSGLQRAGLQPRQSVAIMLPTSPEYFDTYFGILLAGGIPVPIYPPARTPC